jgi:hypothetical protein
MSERQKQEINLLKSSINLSAVFFFFFYFFLVLHRYPGQFTRTSTNPTGSEVNDHVSLQWPSYKQPHGSNLRPQREQTS